MEVLENNQTNVEDVRGLPPLHPLLKELEYEIERYNNPQAK